MLLSRMVNGFRRTALGLVCLGAVSSGCSRSAMPEGDGTYQSACLTTADCESANACEKRACIQGFCQLESTVTCDDADPCTTDRCVPETGHCESLPRTSDEDGDGHRSSLLGTRPGASGSCGDDCDDSSAEARPGGEERCDGVDNDCNGIIDDGAAIGAPSTPLLVSLSRDGESTPASLTYADGQFAMTTMQNNERWQGYFQAVNAEGVPTIAPVALTLPTSDGMAGPLIWTGAVYATAWEDRREGSYDIYFNRLDPWGKKLGPDVRITDTEGFSVEPSLLWDGSEWIIAFSEEYDGGRFRTVVRRLSYDGSPAGDPVVVTDRFVDTRRPRLFLTPRGLSLFYNVANDGPYLLSLDNELMPAAAPVAVPAEDVGELAVRWNRDRFVLAWSVRTTSYGSEILGMTLDETGRVLSQPRAIVSGASLARTPHLTPYGDRSFLIWADDFFDFDGLELSGQMFDQSLQALGSRQRLTRLFTESFSPMAAQGEGNLGVLFRSRAMGVWQSYFLGLRCLEGQG